MTRSRISCLALVLLVLAAGCDKRKWTGRSGSLQRAAAVGDFERVQTLLARGANVNARDEEDNTALHEAARHGQYAVAQFLIGRGANVNVQNNRGQTPVTLAMEGDPLVNRLMKDGMRWMPASERDRGTLVELLAAVGAEPTFRLGAYLGDAELVRRLIAGGMDVNAKDGGRTPLHWAASYGRREIAGLLLGAGANVSVQDAAGLTPLHAAASCGNTDIAQQLVAKGADMNVRGKEGETPLDVAVQQGRTEMVKFLLAAGAGGDAETTNSGRQATSIQAAIEAGWPDVAEALILAGVEVNTKDKSGWTPLHAAITASYDPCVYEIIQREHLGVNFDRWDQREVREKLMREVGDRIATRVATLLIDHHADVNAKDEHGVTPLHCAASMGLRSVVELLVEKGADINARATQGGIHSLYYPPDGAAMPLHEAVACGQPEVVESLLAHGAEIDGADESGRTPLHYAISGRDDRIVELLIAKGANINARDRNGEAPLLYALHNGCTAVAKMLIAAGAEKVTVKNAPGQTVLLWAFRRGDKEWVQLLLDNGAAPDELDENGNTLLHLVVRRGDESMTRMLVAAGADVNAKDPRGATPLHYAAAGSTALASLLLTNGVDINVRAKNGDTPLHKAALRGNREMVELLLAHGADASLKNSRGRTPRDEALRRGHADLAPLLTSAAGPGNTKAENEDPGQ